MQSSDLDLTALRENYTKGQLDQSNVASDPIEQFKIWFNEAVSSKLQEPNAMLVSTVSQDNRPSARIVLLKNVHNGGFVWFTNYHSKKGKELATNAYACLTFFWGELERQVRIEGIATKVAPEESDQYFAIRPRSSQLGAWSSNQSEPIPDRKYLENREKELEEKFAGQLIPRPEHWGGYILIPDYMEFWQGRPSRLHDRIAYTRQADQNWLIERLAP
ncbi:MAG: pyridoxamine 5'-phosphate oxidase [Siphonobacter sp.]